MSCITIKVDGKSADVKYVKWPTGGLLQFLEMLFVRSQNHGWLLQKMFSAVLCSIAFLAAVVCF
jgi:hypothetical protein